MTADIGARGRRAGPSSRSMSWSRCMQQQSTSCTRACVRKKPLGGGPPPPACARVRGLPSLATRRCKHCPTQPPSPPQGLRCWLPPRRALRLLLLLLPLPPLPQLPPLLLPPLRLLLLHEQQGLARQSFFLQRVQHQLCSSASSSSRGSRGGGVVGGGGGRVWLQVAACGRALLSGRAGKRGAGAAVLNGQHQQCPSSGS